MDKKKFAVYEKKPLEAAVGLTSRSNKRFVSSKVTPKCDVICFF